MEVVIIKVEDFFVVLGKSRVGFLVFWVGFWGDCRRGVEG